MIFLKKKLKGFSLIELLLVIALFSSVILISTPVYQRLQSKNDLEIASTVVVNSLRRAQILSQSVRNDDSWGVNVQANSVTIFKGVSYAGRDTSFDEVINLTNNNLIISGITEIYFSKLSGLPNTSGDIIITINNNDSKNININSKGTISY